MLLLGLADGDVHGYDSSGIFVLKVPMVNVENVELETALSSRRQLSTQIFLCAPICAQV